MTLLRRPLPPPPPPSPDAPPSFRVANARSKSSLPPPPLPPPDISIYSRSFAAELSLRAIRDSRVSGIGKEASGRIPVGFAEIAAGVSFPMIDRRSRFRIASPPRRGTEGTMQRTMYRNTAFSLPRMLMLAATLPQEEISRFPGAGKTTFAQLCLGEREIRSHTPSRANVHEEEPFGFGNTASRNRVSSFVEATNYARCSTQTLGARERKATWNNK